MNVNCLQFSRVRLSLACVADALVLATSRVGSAPEALFQGASVVEAALRAARAKVVHDDSTVAALHKAAETRTSVDVIVMEGRMAVIPA